MDTHADDNDNRPKDGVMAPSANTRDEFQQKLMSLFRDANTEMELKMPSFDGGPPAATTSELDQTRAEVMANLERLGQIQTGDDSLIFSGTQFILPESMKGSIPNAVAYLRDYEKSQEAEFSITRSFNYRPWDGANAFQRAMVRVFGTSGIGKPTVTMFGKNPPEYRTVAAGFGESIQVPWGRVHFSPLDATFILHGSSSNEHGIIFTLQVEAPKKYRAHIAAFFQVVEDELKTHSIYKGRAFTGGGEPVFLDTSTIDPSKVVYSQNVLVQLETNLWSVLRHSAAMKAAGLDLKRSVLIEGAYGVGKTLAGQLTAREAVDNNWTFIICRPGKDDLFETLHTAELYAPAVVWFEDIDVIASGKSTEQISQLLDAMDSITTKGVPVLAGFTTNHVETIQKGVLRPGRLDAIIHIGGLDDAGLEKLIKSVLPADLQGDIDYPQVVAAFHDFLPAFAKEATVRALRYAISRSNGNPAPVTTVDLVNAANGLRPQLELMEDAQEGVRTDPLAEVFRRVVAEGMNGAVLIDEDDNIDTTLRTNHNRNGGTRG